MTTDTPAPATAPSGSSKTAEEITEIRDRFWSQFSADAPAPAPGPRYVSGFVPF